MRETWSRDAGWRAGRTALVSLTLVTSAIHFADNAFRLDLYPGPAWLTRNLVLSAWMVTLAAACLAYRSRTRWALVAYGVLGFAGLAHYLMPHRMRLPARCTMTIGGEAVASVLLIGYALLQPHPDQSRRVA